MNQPSQYVACRMSPLMNAVKGNLFCLTLSVFFLCRELLDKKATQSVANNINYRHRMAQYASRASVNLHTHIFFRNQRRDETGYVLFVRQNAVQVSPRLRRFQINLEGRLTP